MIGIIIFAGCSWAGHFAWVNWVSPKAELLGVRVIQFAGKDIIAEPVQVAAVSPAMDNNTRLRNLDAELEQAVRGKWEGSVEDERAADITFWSIGEFLTSASFITVFLSIIGLLICVHKLFKAGRHD